MISTQRLRRHDIRRGCIWGLCAELTGIWARPPSPAGRWHQVRVHEAGVGHGGDRRAAPLELLMRRTRRGTRCGSPAPPSLHQLHHPSLAINQLFLVRSAVLRSGAPLFANSRFLVPYEQTAGGRDHLAARAHEAAAAAAAARARGAAVRAGPERHERGGGRVGGGDQSRDLEAVPGHQPPAT